MDTRFKIILLSVFSVLAVGIGVFLFFKSFCEFAQTTLTEQILAAVLGAVMISIITTILLSAQSAAEERKEKALGVFTLKLDTYSKFLDFIYEIIQDGQLEPPEIKELTKWTTRVALIAGENATNAVSHFTQQCIRLRKLRYADLKQNDIQIWRNWFKDAMKREPDEEDKDFISVGNIVACLRQDLGEMSISKSEQLKVGAVAVDSLVDWLCEGRKGTIQKG